MVGLNQESHPEVTMTTQVTSTPVVTHQTGGTSTTMAGPFQSMATMVTTSSQEDPPPYESLVSAHLLFLFLYT